MDINNINKFIQQSKSKRLDWIDALRAIAIILVVFGHQIPNRITYFVFTSPIKMPLFFIISGFVFKYKGGDFRNILNYIFYRLLIPWVVLELIWLKAIFWIINGKMDELIEYGLNMLSGRANWYMTCYIVASIVIFMVHKVISNEKYRIATLLLLGIIGFFLKYYKIAEYAELNNALLVQFYMAIGIVCKKYLMSILKLPLWTVIFSGIIYIVLGCITCIFYPGQCIDVNTGSYYNYVISLAMIISGNYFIIRVMEKLSRKVNFSKPFLEIGKNTLVIYLLHGYIILGLNYAFKIVNISFKQDLFVASIYTIVAVLVATIIGKILNQICPVLIGNKRK